MENNQSKPLTAEEIVQKTLLAHMSIRQGVEAYADVQTAALKQEIVDKDAQLNELEREVSYLRGLEKLGDKAIDSYHKRYRDEKQLNKTLMGLLKDEYKAARVHHYKMLDCTGYDAYAKAESDWQSFKAEKGLKD